jgi:two-component system, cell cycle response regulator DivK
MSATQPPLVLLVDDFVDALEIYHQYLTFRGYRVVVARSGLEALATARGGECPALILLDVRMSGMTGTEVMQTLRSDAAFAAVPIVAFTAHALQNEEDQMLLAGFDAVIAKPCLPEDLASHIDALLGRGNPVS